jgi:hypothetical protein
MGCLNDKARSGSRRFALIGSRTEEHKNAEKEEVHAQKKAVQGQDEDKDKEVQTQVCEGTEAKVEDKQKDRQKENQGEDSAEEKGVRRKEDKKTNHEAQKENLGQDGKNQGPADNTEEEVEGSKTQEDKGRVQATNHNPHRQSSAITPSATETRRDNQQGRQNTGACASQLGRGRPSHQRRP